jgi:hypothetical protein
LVCNDSRVVELLKEFIPVADGCERYATVSGFAPRKQALEYSLMHGAMRQTFWRDSFETPAGHWHCQGMFILTPSGKVLAGSNHPMNANINVDALRKGLELYAKMPREERLLPRAPDPKADRMFPESDQPRPPVDGLVLRVVSRGLKEDVGAYDELSPRFYHIDRLWYTREEALQFLPDKLELGQRKDITGPVVKGLAQLYLIAGHSQFYDNEVKELRLTSEVTRTEDKAVHVKLRGRAILEATHRFNPSKYHPDLLGDLTYNLEKNRFTHFELLAYGTRSIGDNAERRDGPECIPMAYRFSLSDGSYLGDDQVPTKIPLYRFVKLRAGPASR